MFMSSSPKQKNMKTSYHNYKMLGLFNRKFKITERRPPPDVLDAFSFCTGGTSEMSPEMFRKFLVEFQGQGEDGFSVGDAEKSMEQVLHRVRPEFKTCCFGVDDFFKYLFLDDLNGPIATQVHHDMNAPLQHYFIYTGHNSYLTGNQLNSDCSDVPIIKALQRGVRVIELDLWPNSAKDGIHVYHGRTMTTPVTLDICFKSIKEHAFVTNPYPVIITLEDHLTPNLQAKVATMVIEIFGDMLFCPQKGDTDDFRSPESLKRHIILSTKPPAESKLQEEIQSPSSSKNGKLTDNKINSNQEDNISGLNQELSQFLRVDFEDEYEDVESEKVGQKAPLEYIELIGIHAAKAKKGLRKALTEGKGKRLSLSEQTLQKAAAQYGTDLVRFTQKNILRIFPKGTRVTSTNFRPLEAWMHGAQMVAFNMQGYGRSLWMMHGMFRSNGGCGYVKKPDFLMRTGPNGEVFDPKAMISVKKTLKVRVYMGDGWRMDFSHGHFDKFSPPDFYTKLYMVGVPADEAKKQTRVIKDDWMPVWDEEFTFGLTVPELALLKIVVREHDDIEKDDFGGQTCLPVSELRTGIRTVPLHCKKGDKFQNVKLLMKFSFE